MHRQLVPAIVFVALVLSSARAAADHVLVLPASTDAPGRIGASELQTHARSALSQLGHSLVPAFETQAALNAAPATALNAEQYATLARMTAADWVVVASASPDSARLEMTAFQTSSGRTETVARDVMAGSLADQLRDMAAVLLRPEGVGTAALPWESQPVAPPSSPPAPPKLEATAPQPRSNDEPRFSLAAGPGFSCAVVRPDSAVGTACSFVIGAHGSVRVSDDWHLGLALRPLVTGPRATLIEATARYDALTTAQQRLRLGAVLAPGVMFMHGGAKTNSFALRGSLAASYALTERWSLDARAGELTWVPASSGTVLLAGAALYGMARF